MMQSLSQAMIFAAGLGTRLRPLTDTVPKALIPINGKPLLGYILEKLSDYGIQSIVINVHHHARKIHEFLSNFPSGRVSIQISDESDRLLDTGGGLKKAMPLFDLSKPILLHNVDVITNLDLDTFYRFHMESGNLVTLFVQQRNSNRYLLLDDRLVLCGRKNVSTGETLITRPSDGTMHEYAFNGVHIVNPEIFKLMPDLDIFSLTDFYLELSPNQKIGGYCDNSAIYLDIGKPESLQKASGLL